MLQKKKKRITDHLRSLIYYNICLVPIINTIRHCFNFSLVLIWWCEALNSDEATKKIQNVPLKNMCSSLIQKNPEYPLFGKLQQILLL